MGFFLHSLAGSSSFLRCSPGLLEESVKSREEIVWNIFHSLCVCGDQAGVICLLSASRSVIDEVVHVGL
jgi:hypothetical protein